MPKVVETPLGPVTVLTEEEFEDFQEEQSKTPVFFKDGKMLCPKCCGFLEAIEVYHLVFEESRLRITGVIIAEAEAIVTYEASFCRDCETAPLFAGLPILSETSHRYRVT